MVAGQTGARVVKLPLGADRLPDIASLSALITPRSRVLAIGQMSNVTGGCPDLAQAIRLAHAAGMVVMVDGAQGAVHFPADVQALDIDFYAFSGHKLYGPTGIGALYGKSELLAAMSPWLGGGKMIAEVSFDGFTPQPAPYGLEAGTPKSPGLSASAPRWSGWRRAISARRKTGAAVWRAWRRGTGETAGLPLFPLPAVKPAGL